MVCWDRSTLKMRPLAEYRCCACSRAQEHTATSKSCTHRTPFLCCDSIERLLLAFDAFRSRRLLRNCSACLPAQLIAWTIELGIIFGELFDFKELIFFDAGEILPRISRRPPDLKIQNARVLAKPNVLLQRRRSE